MKISLYNRDRFDVYLEHISDNMWKLNCPDYYRIIYNEDSTGIQAIDPPGGPFLAIGAKIQDKQVTGIMPGKIIILEDAKSDN